MRERLDPKIEVRLRELGEKLAAKQKGKWQCPPAGNEYHEMEASILWGLSWPDWLMLPVYRRGQMLAHYLEKQMRDAVQSPELDEPKNQPEVAQGGGYESFRRQFM